MAKRSTESLILVSPAQYQGRMKRCFRFIYVQSSAVSRETRWCQFKTDTIFEIACVAGGFCLFVRVGNATASGVSPREKLNSTQLDSSLVFARLGRGRQHKFNRANTNNSASYAGYLRTSYYMDRIKAESSCSFSI